MEEKLDIDDKLNEENACKKCNSGIYFFDCECDACPDCKLGDGYCECEI